MGIQGLDLPEWFLAVAFIGYFMMGLSGRGHIPILTHLPKAYMAKG